MWRPWAPSPDPASVALSPHPGPEAKPPQVLCAHASQVGCSHTCMMTAGPRASRPDCCVLQGSPRAVTQLTGGSEPGCPPITRHGAVGWQWAVTQGGAVIPQPDGTGEVPPAKAECVLHFVWGGGALSGGQTRSTASAHTGDRSTRWADWLLLSQGLSLVEAVPSWVPFICEAQGSEGCGL